MNGGRLGLADGAWMDVSEAYIGLESDEFKNKDLTPSPANTKNKDLTPNMTPNMTPNP